MLNNLFLIIIMILSLSLAFYCVDSHKSNILSMVNINDKNLTQAEITPVAPIKKVYVEELAVEDAEERSSVKVVEEEEPEVESPTGTINKVEEKKVPQKRIESIEKRVPKEEKTFTIERNKAVESTNIESKNVSEYSEGYKLDALEEMIKEELNKEKKD